MEMKKWLKLHAWAALDLQEDKQLLEEKIAKTTALAVVFVL